MHLIVKTPSALPFQILPASVDGHMVEREVRHDTDLPILFPQEQIALPLLSFIPAIVRRTPQLVARKHPLQRTQIALPLLGFVAGAAGRAVVLVCPSPLLLLPEAVSGQADGGANVMSEPDILFAVGHSRSQRIRLITYFRY